MSDLISRQAEQPDTHDTNVGDATHKNVIYSPVQMAMDYAVNATDFSASSDTISRQAAIDALDGEFNITGRENAETIRDYINGVSKKLRELPSAERRGRWKFNIDDKGWSWDKPYMCDQCGEWVEKVFKFCPNCGAKMEEGEK